MTDVLDARWRDSAARREVPLFDVVAERAATVGVGLLIMAGFASSYTTLRDLAVEVGGFSPWLAPVVPLSFDLGIVVLSLKVVLAARAGRDARVLRALVLALSAATVVANGAASSTAVGRLLHAVPPAMFVVCFETLAASARHDAHGRRAAAPPQGPLEKEMPLVLTMARWVSAPRQTWAIWRAQVLGSDGPVEVVLTAVTRAAAAPPRPHDESREESGVTGADERPGAVPAGTAHRPAGPRSRRPAMGVVVGSPSQENGDRPVPRDTRLAVAINALRADPAITAVALADHLHTSGHPASVRTAQRVRHQAQKTLREASGGGSDRAVVRDEGTRG